MLKPTRCSIHRFLDFPGWDVVIILKIICLIICAYQTIIFKIYALHY